MGKNWRGGGKGGGGGGGGNDFASCRDHGVIIGTCDAARERETSKELVNLLNQAIEEEYPELLASLAAKDGETTDAPAAEKSSIEQLLREELNDVRQKKHSGAQHVVSINTGVKGITLIKIVRWEICPLVLVKSIFARVKKEKEACCRHVVRIVPLKHVFFPNEEELREKLKYVIDHGLYEDGVIDTLPPVVPKKPRSEDKESSEEKEATEEVEEPDAKRQKVEETPEEAPKVEEETVEETPAAPVVTYTGPKFPYMIHFKARNHNVITKDLTVSIASEYIKPYAYGDYKTPQVVILVEALKNLGGMTWLRNCDEYMDFNIRRYQAEHAKSDV